MLREALRSRRERRRRRERLRCELAEFRTPAERQELDDLCGRYDTTVEDLLGGREPSVVAADRVRPRVRAGDSKEPAPSVAAERGRPHRRPPRPSHPVRMSRVVRDPGRARAGLALVATPPASRWRTVAPETAAGGRLFDPEGSTADRGKSATGETAPGGGGGRHYPGGPESPDAVSGVAGRRRDGSSWRVVQVMDERLQSRAAMSSAIWGRASEIPPSRVVTAACDATFFVPGQGLAY